MAGLFDRIRLGSALRTLKSAASWIHNTAVDYSKEKNILIRMYYDSELGSPIEQTVEKAYATSAYDTLKEFVPNWKPALNMCQSVGNWIAQKKVQVLDASKLLYKISTNQITNEQAYSELAKRTTSGLFTVGKVACRAAHAVAWLTGKISDTVLPEGVSEYIKKGFDITVGETLRGVRNKIFSEENKQRVEGFIKEGFKVAHTAIEKVIDVADRAIEKTSEFISNVAHKVGEKESDFTEKVKNTARNVGHVIKNTWDSIKSFFWRR